MQNEAGEYVDLYIPRKWWVYFVKHIRWSSCVNVKQLKVVSKNMIENAKFWYCSAKIRSNSYDAIDINRLLWHWVLKPVFIISALRATASLPQRITPQFNWTLLTLMRKLAEWLVVPRHMPSVEPFEEWENPMTVLTG